MAEYPIHPYIIHCLELLLANAAAPVVLALDGRCGSGKTTMATALAEQFPDSIVLHTDDFYLPPADRVPGWEQTPMQNNPFYTENWWQLLKCTMLASIKPTTFKKRHTFFRRNKRR